MVDGARSRGRGFYGGGRFCGRWFGRWFGRHVLRGFREFGDSGGVFGLLTLLPRLLGHIEVVIGCFRHQTLRLIIARRRGNSPVKNGICVWRDQGTGRRHLYGLDAGGVGLEVEGRPVRRHGLLVEVFGLFVFVGF